MKLEKEDNIEVPQGMSNPWKFVQKRIIFEGKIAMVDAITKYHKIFSRDKENDAMLQESVNCMRQLYLEIKWIIKKNKKAKSECQGTIKYMDSLVDDIKQDFLSDDFPEIYKHYVGLLEMLVHIGLTDIESKNEDPRFALETNQS